MCDRFVADILLQPPNAAAAASMARRVSAASALGTLPTTSPVAGLWTSVVAPLAASTCSPLMNIWAKDPPPLARSRVYAFQYRAQRNTTDLTVACLIAWRGNFERANARTRERANGVPW